jgi:hypothetical protein
MRDDKIRVLQYSNYSQEIEHFVDMVDSSDVVLTPSGSNYTTNLTSLGGVTLVPNTGQTVLLTNQTNPAENLVYVVTSESGGLFTLAISQIYNTFTAYNGRVFGANEGTFAGCLHSISTTDPFTPGVTAVTVTFIPTRIELLEQNSLSNTLTDTNILVGNASNVATGVAMTGDVAIANTGATTIQTDAVTTTKILDANITNAKLATAPANTYKGNNTAGVSGVTDVTTNTAFNKNYETTPANILVNGTASVGVLDTVARADHIHPQDTLKADKIPNTLDIVDLPTGGDIGLATATVDIYEKFNINQTTDSQTITLPIPTDNTNNKIIYVANVGTSTFSIYGADLPTGRHVALIHDTSIGWMLAYFPVAGGGVPVFTGATALVDGTEGLVVQPLAGDENKFLRGDATWAAPSGAPEFYGFKIESSELVYEHSLTNAIATDYLTSSIDPVGVVYSLDVEGNLIGTF